MTATRVLVTGASGQLGRELVTRWTDLDVVGTTRGDLDVADRAQALRVVDEVRPDVVVNCAAWTDVDGCEGDEDRAMAVNATGAGNVAEAAAAVGARVVQVSTDYVHSGTAPRRPDGERRAWREDDPVDPLNAYGRSKAAGERLVAAATSDHVVVRTAWVCGEHGGNFVRTMLRLGRAGRSLRVVDDQVGSPTFTADLAAALRELLDGDATGVVNRTNTGSCSWFELATAVFEEAGLDVEVAPQPSSALDRPAPRPAWSVLDDARARSLGLTPLPPWRDGLRRLVAAYDGVDLDA